MKIIIIFFPGNANAVINSFNLDQLCYIFRCEGRNYLSDYLSLFLIKLNIYYFGINEFEY
ncbi:hypothetical protein HanRHA438_Chr09g0426741 [Helianthus annuus]|nr:hypothetical protein HanIR_Chr09g0446621 [Helianthus annuus]KAJ0890698.1 hypothetical protein HanRHA438_Chr09g0426741 [Helianthus annuus]